MDNRLNLTEAEKVGYYISQINNDGAKIFLVNSSKLEIINKEVNYQYRIVFYKLDNKNEIPIYAFKVSFISQLKILYKNCGGKKMRKIISIVLVFFISFSYVFSDVEISEFEKGRMAGKEKAKSYNSIGYFMLGCLLNWVGFFIAMGVDPVVPTDDLIGKSDEYVNGYMESYKKEVKGKNISGALVGSLISTGVIIVGGVILVVYVVNAAQTASQSCLSKILSEMLTKACTKSIIYSLISIGF